MKTILYPLGICLPLLAVCFFYCRKPAGQDRGRDPNQSGLEIPHRTRASGAIGVVGLSDYHPRFDIFQLPGPPNANKVIAIVQDAAGFLWFGTEYGLIRYDGNHFETYRYNRDESVLMKEDGITSIHVDAQGVVWYGSFENGLTAFDPTTSKFTRYLHNAADSSSLPDNYVSDVKEDRQGYLWIATGHGLSRFVKKTARFKNFYAHPDQPNSLSYDDVRKLFIDREGILWVACAPDGNSDDKAGERGALNRYNLADETFTRFLLPLAQHGGTANNHISALFEDSRGVFYVGTEKGVQIFDRKTSAFIALPLVFDHPEPLPINIGDKFRPDVQPLRTGASPLFHISFITEDSDSHIWFGAYGIGLTVYDPQTGLSLRFNAGSTGAPGLSTGYIENFCQGRDGVVWLSSGGGGGMVYKIKPQGALFNYYTFERLGIDKGAQTTDFLEDRRGYLWCGLKNARCALLRLDRKSGQIVHFMNNEDVNSLSSFKTNQLMEDRNGYIWASTWNGLFKIDPISCKILKRFIKHQNDPDGPSFVKARDLLEDLNGDIWITTYSSGLDRYEPRTGKFYHYLHDSTAAASIASNATLSLCKDSKGNIIVGCSIISSLSPGPIFIDRFNAQTNKFEHLAPAGVNGFVPKMIPDDQGDIWFHNPDGFYKLNPKTKKVQIYTSANSNLPGDQVLSAKAGKNGVLWLTTLHDVIELNTLNDSFYRYDQYDGVQIDSMDIQAAYISSHGEYFFGGKGGVQSFYTEEMVHRNGKQAPDLRIVGFRVDGKPAVPGPGSPLRQPVWQATEARLSANQDAFSIAVANFDFRNPSVNTLEFKLEPFDSAWRRDLRDGEASYNHIPSGEYIFHLRGMNSDGVSGEKALAITVASPVWTSLWFLALAAGLFSLATWQATRYFANRKLKVQALELEKQQALQKERDRIAAEMHDDMGSGLSMIRLLSERASAQTTDKDQKGRVDKIAEQAKELVENMSTIIWAMNSRNDTAEGLVAFLRRYAFEYSEMNNLICRFPLPGDVPGWTIRGEVRRSVFLAFKEALLNVVKHAEAESVEINAVFKDGRLKITLRDNGKGFQSVSATSSELTPSAFAGMGLLNMQQRMTSLGGSFHITSSSDEGTTVVLETPIQAG